MSDYTLVVPSQNYDPSHERLRNRRIEEAMRRSAMNLSDQLRAVLLPVCNVSELPASQLAGVRGFVLDATSPSFGATVTGGGSTPVPVYYDGSAWRVG